LLLAALLTASLLCNLQILWGKRSYIAKGYFDFLIYYTGAEIVNAGKGDDLYNLKVQQAYQEKFKVVNQPWSILPFNHAPYELLVFLPLATLSFQAAHIIWSVISILFLVIAWRVLAGFIIDGEQRYLSAGLVLAFYPTTTTLQMGQDSTMSLLILTGVFAALKQRREILAGGILALGLYKPHLVLPLAGILTVSGYWCAMLGFFATAVILATTSLAMVGWQGATGLFTIIVGMKNPTSIVDPESMTNLRGLSFVILNLFGLKSMTNTITTIASMIVYGCCLWLWKSRARTESPIFDLKYSLAIVATVLVSFHLYAHDAIILVIAAIILLNHVFTDRAGTMLVKLGSGFALLVLFMPFVPFYLTVKGGLGWGAFIIIVMFVFIACEIVSLTVRQVAPHVPKFVESTTI
jgi:hypothetical protein